MNPALTLEWSYTPADFFEGPVDYTLGNYIVHIDDGRAVATFDSDQPQSVFPAVHSELEARFLGAQLMRHKPFQLSGYDTRRNRHDGTAVLSRSFALTVEPMMDNIDVVIRDADGKITTDTKADRINATNELSELAAKHIGDPVAAAILKSYNAAVDDPSKGLAHLYDIRDALAKEFGGDQEARSMLGISRNKWSELGRLANDEPLRQGRHRGQNVGQLRDATDEETANARSAAYEMIRKYLEYLG